VGVAPVPMRYMPGVQGGALQNQDGMPGGGRGAQRYSNMPMQPVRQNSEGIPWSFVTLFQLVDGHSLPN